MKQPGGSKVKGQRVGVSCVLALTTFFCVGVSGGGTRTKPSEELQTTFRHKAKPTFTNISLQMGTNGRMRRVVGRPVSADFKPVTGGAAARSAPHKVRLSNDLNTRGAVTLTTPDGNVLRSHVLALSYTDAATGRSVLLAALKSCQGVGVGGDQVLYKDAFSGLRADVRYTYRGNNFEQDVILREQPPAPELFGLNPKSTRLEVLTEFVGAPSPVKRIKTINWDSAERHSTKTPKLFSSVVPSNIPAKDEELDFGASRIIGGKAFAQQPGRIHRSKAGLQSREPSPVKTGSRRPNASVPVAKTWQTIEGRTFLVEQVDYLSARRMMATLPKAKWTRGLVDASSQNLKQLAVMSRTLPAVPPLGADAVLSMPMLAASSATESEGLVLDYIIVNEAIENLVWIDDTPPADADVFNTDTANGQWTWSATQPAPISGTQSHVTGIAAGFHQHGFQGTSATLPVYDGDRLYTYVYLDPANPPSEVMLQYASQSYEEVWVGQHQETITYDCNWVDEYDEDGNVIGGYWETCEETVWVDDYETQIVFDWEHRAYWGANNIALGTDGTASRRYMGPLPPSGQWVRLEIPAELVGLVDTELGGVAFTLHGGRAVFDYTGKLNQDPDVPWFDDAYPAGATPITFNETPNWIAAAPAPFSGSVAHESPLVAGRHEHGFVNASDRMSVDANDTLYAHVWIDPANPPATIELWWRSLSDVEVWVDGYEGWYSYDCWVDEYDEDGNVIGGYWDTCWDYGWIDGHWETVTEASWHRAHWGAATSGSTPMGPLPALGQWVRLEVPASALALEGRPVDGMIFSLYGGGRAVWDVAGKSRVFISDSDGDGLDDNWEFTHFGNLLAQNGAGDADGDGLSNLGEYANNTNPNISDTDEDLLPDGWEVDMGLNPLEWWDAWEDLDQDGLWSISEYTLGYHPLQTDTRATGIRDGDKDKDSDGLSNAAEIDIYQSNPDDAYSLNASKSDGLYLKSSQAGDPNSEVQTTLQIVGNNLRFTLVNLPPGAKWDMFYRPDLNSGTRWRIAQFGATDQTQFDYPLDGPFGYFVFGSATDSDSDGLTDAYELLVTRTVIDNPDSESLLVAGRGGNFRADGDEDFDNDGIASEYEARLGIDPFTAQSQSDPDDDGLPTWLETLIGTNPNSRYTGANTVSDTVLDNDGDGFGNLFEFMSRQNPSRDEGTPFAWSGGDFFQGEIVIPSIPSALPSRDPDNPQFFLMGKIYDIAGSLAVEDRGTDFLVSWTSAQMPETGYGLWEPDIPDPLPDGTLTAIRDLLQVTTEISLKRWAQVNQDILLPMAEAELELGIEIKTARIAAEYRNLQHVFSLGGNSVALEMRAWQAVNVIDSEATALSAMFKRLSSLTTFGELAYVYVPRRAGGVISLLTTAYDINAALPELQLQMTAYASALQGTDLANLNAEAVSLAAMIGDLTPLPLVVSPVLESWLGY